MKSYRGLLLLVVVVMLIMMPMAAMASSGGSGEPGGNCPDEGYRYQFAPPPWMGELSVECIDSIPGNAFCESVLFSGEFTLMGSNDVANFNSVVWIEYDPGPPEIGIKIADFEGYTARAISGLCLTQGDLIRPFEDIYEIPPRTYYFIEILGAHNMAVSEGGLKYTFDVLIMGLNQAL